MRKLGLSENGTIKSYSFEITTNNNDIITIAISQKGGHIVFMNYNRDVLDKKISVKEAEDKAIEFLNSKGYINMKKTYSIKEQGIITINYAYEEDNVIVYPDLIKVKVALDNGDILGIETTGYLNNHEKRDVDKSDIITSEEAMKLANENLKIEETRLAIIPTEFKTEVFCWELKGTVEKRNFLLYVNAKTGKVEDILVIIQTENGTLTQ
jgi:germination protein YpeB